MKTNMLKLVLVIFIFQCSISFGQNNDTKKPKYVIIVNNEIITKKKLEEYGKQGRIKKMSKGVTSEEWNILAKKFGDKIGDREFIIKVDLFTEKEKQKREVEKKQKMSINKKQSNDELKLHIDDRAKDFTVLMTDGKKQKFSDLKGKVVLINYWATWCAPCLMELVEIQKKIIEPFNNKKFVFIPIAIGENKKKVEQKILYMKKYGINYSAGIDSTKKIWNQYATGTIPKNFLIDKKGVVRCITIGNTKENIDKLVKEIKKLLE